MTRVELETAFNAGQESAAQTFDQHTEVYTVRDAVWQAAGMEPWDGCLCIGCLEQRLGWRLRPKDFQRNHPFGLMPGTQRLMNRQKR
jgi:hypothetical protein